MKKSKLLCLIISLILLIQVISGCSEKNNSLPVDFKPLLQSDESPQKPLIINILDVGQGDSIFIVLPNNQSILIDAGYDEQSEYIIEYIKASGDRTLDYVIATHPHADHIGGMPTVINEFDVKNFYMPKASHTTVTFENLLDAIEEKNLAAQYAKAGVILFDFGDLKAEFIAPIKDSYNNLNNYSAVLLLTYKEKNFLFMGDAEIEVEAEILSSGFNINIDVLKVGHHGSHTASSRSFIESIKPSKAIISVGQNSYGHPHNEVLTTLNEFNADIWRTDDKGTVIITSDGINITLENVKNSVQPNAPPDNSISDFTNDTTDDTTDEKKQSSEVEQNNTVYITNTGEKYHRSDCRYLYKSKIPVSLNYIDINKYSPCSVCNPPAK